MVSKREERYLARARVRQAANSSLSASTELQPLFDPALPRLPIKPQNDNPVAPGHIDQCVAKTATADPYQTFLEIATSTPTFAPHVVTNLADWHAVPASEGALFYASRNNAAA